MKPEVVAPFLLEPPPPPLSCRPGGGRRSPAGPGRTVRAPVRVISRLGEVSLQTELLGDEAEEAGRPGVGPGVAGLRTANTEADDANPGVAKISSGGDQVRIAYERSTRVPLTRVLTCRDLRTVQLQLLAQPHLPLKHKAAPQDS